MPSNCTAKLVLSVLLPMGAADFAATPPAANAAAPILVLSDDVAANPFGDYLAEILRGEGLLAFDHLDRADWSAAPNAAAQLNGYSAVVMAEMSTTLAEQQMLRDYVQAGGVLIGARPDIGLSDVLGIEFAGNRPERLHQYFGVDPGSTPGLGITQGPLQYHGIAANYNLQGATSLATLYANSGVLSSYPAATTHSYGQGKAIALAFDPAKSVVLTRQGNPEWQNTEGDGIVQYRPHDMFARTDGRTYYDPERMAIPHADEVQRFLANVLIDANDAPLPRMWYLPGTHKSIMVNTGDGEDNYDFQFDPILADAASYGGKFTVYLRDFGVANTTVGKEAQWRAAGHEVGVHAYADGREGAGAESYMDFAYGRVVNSLNSKFGHVSRTARNHTIDWTGWVDMARIEQEHGTLLDTNYYHYLNGNIVDKDVANGYFTGSGLAQRFIDETGEMLDIYQIGTPWPDEWFADWGFTTQQAVDVMVGMFEAAESQGYYSAFVNNIHPVRYYGADITRSWARAIWQYCQSQGIPMWSAEMLLDFNLARNESRFENLEYSPGLLEFDYIAGAAGQDLTLMLPMLWSDQQLTELTVDGITAAFVIETIKGVDYAMLTTPVAQARVAAAYARPVDADFNHDGRVDGQDLAQWQIDFGTHPSSDADGDGDSDGQDFLAWQRQFTDDSPLAAQRAVPEPSPLALLAVGAAGFSVRRRGSGSRLRISGDT